MNLVTVMVGLIPKLDDAYSRETEHMNVACDSDSLCQECGHSFQGHLPNSGSHFEEVGWA